MIFSLTHMLLIVLFICFFIFLLFPVEKFLSKIFKIEVSKNSVFLVILSLSFLIILKINPLVSFANILITIICFLIFLSGFLSNRKYIYILAFIFLILTPVMIIVGIDPLAKFFSQACYFLLVLGVLRDLFYEKIFE